MRKLDKKAKRGIVLFAVCCLLTAGGIAACMVLVMNARGASWQLGAGATVYDNVYTPVTLEAAAAALIRSTPVPEYGIWGIPPYPATPRETRWISSAACTAMRRTEA